MLEAIASNPKAVSVRIQSDQAGRAGGQRKHDLRHAPLPNYVDSQRIHLNSVIIEPISPVDLRTICKERRAGRKTKRAMKCNASVCISGIIVFGKAVQSDFNKLSILKQNAAYRDVAEAIAKRLNTTLTGLVAHRDETAPHAHFQLPGYDLKGNAVSTVTKRAVTSELQTITAEVMKRHVASVERGRNKYERLKAGAEYKDTVHRSVKKLHDDLPAEITAASALREAILGDAEKLAARVIKLREQEALTVKEVKRLEIYKQRLKVKENELANLDTKTTQMQQAYKVTESRRAAIEVEASKIREAVIAEATKAARDLLKEAHEGAKQEALRITKETSERLEKTLLTYDQNALLKAERERDQWRTGFVLLRDIFKEMFPDIYKRVAKRWQGRWDNDQNNPTQKPKPSKYSGPYSP